MILSKVEIHGFKSFGKKAELKFDGKITSVVGPNGCGKTNVVDAIRWGLGEQRPSVLRADRMDSIIFGGTQSARPLGMAEVTVTFDNSNNVLPIDYTSVAVTRRLYRSGESEYLLNKNQVRLKDIQDLLMDTGIGADVYSVIELKMVEDILSDKAEDRRRLLEEAAGVTKYKHRLKAAMRKLDSNKNDLLRVNDIIQEVERSVRSLKRQVDGAQKYQNFNQQVQSLELRKGYVIYRDLLSRLEPLKLELSSLHGHKDIRITDITRVETELESLKLDLARREKDMLEAQEALNRVVERIHHKEGDIRVGRERMASLADRITRYGAEIESMGKRLEEQNQHLEMSQREREALQVKITSTQRIFINKKKELEVFQQGLNLKRLDLNAKKKEVIECLESVNKLTTGETQLRAKVDNNLGRLSRLEEEDKVFLGTQDRVHQTKSRLDESIRSAETERGRAASKRNQLADAEARSAKSIEEIRERLYKDRGELDLVKNRQRFLRQVIENHEGVTDGAKLILKEKAAGLLGILADIIDTKPVHRTAIEAGLGEASRYLMFSGSDEAFGALSWLKSKGGGRVSLAYLGRMKASKSDSRPALPDVPGVVGWADELVECDSRVRPIADILLGDLIIAETPEAARACLDQTDGRCRVATLAGEMMTGWGIHSSGEGASDSGMVGRTHRLKELEGELGKLTARLTESESALTHEEKKRADLLKERAAVEAELKSVEARALQLDKERAQIDFEGKNAEQGLKKNSDERQKLLAEIENGKESLENLRPQMELLVDKREAVEGAIAQIQSDVDRLEGEEKIMEEEVHRLNLSVVRLNGEARNLDYDIERSQTLISETTTTIAQRNQEIQDAHQEIATCRTQTAETENGLGEEFAEKAKLETGLQEKERLYQSQKEALAARDHEVREVRKDQDAISEKIHSLSIEAADLEHRANATRDRIRETCEQDIAILPEQEPIEPIEADREIEDVKRKIKALGPVNLMALGEYDQEKQRLDFLTQQRDDLMTAEETLKETILKINETARQRFIDVFAEVRKNFQQTFIRFFPGGEADIRLPDDQDPLEARIDIVARPAGKHLRDIELLSAGEKTLTAISLLFSLYQVKPSPFCILDEIDAPLDDANVERFTRVLAEYAEKTQFVIVTHNKMTMKAAQALYGVTMEEEGVSKIVSVKFEEANKVL